MYFTDRKFFPLFCVLALFSLITSGCQKNKDTITSQEYVLNRPALSILFESVHDLKISFRGEGYVRLSRQIALENRPEIGDRCRGLITLSAPLYCQWKIQSFQSEKTPTNGILHTNTTFASTQFVHHLLETLSTLTPTHLAPKAKLETYGLNPPQVTIEWTQNKVPNTLLLGLATDESRKENTLQLAALLPHSEQPFYVKGALIQMLQYLRPIDSIREKKVVGYALDDFDIVEGSLSTEFSKKFSIKNKNKSRFYRLQADWGDKKGKASKNSDTIQSALEAIFHLQTVSEITELTESPLLKEKLSIPLLKKNFKNHIHLALYDRLAKEGTASVEILFFKTSTRWIALHSKREGILFELHPESEKHLTNLARVF